MKEPGKEFQRVVKMLPCEDAERIRKVWAEVSDGKPRIKLLPKAKLAELRVRWAATDGKTYYFREELFDDRFGIPGHVLDAAIAHELAHTRFRRETQTRRVYERIKTVSRGAEPRPMTEIARTERQVRDFLRVEMMRDFDEGEAWVAAEHWGFDQAKALDWLEKHLP